MTLAMCLVLSAFQTGCGVGSEPTVTLSDPQSETKNEVGADYWSPGPANDPVTNAHGHWVKHRAEFPEYRTAGEYIEAAQAFLARPPPGTLKKSRPNGDRLFYDPSTNTFAVGTATGAPRTMFRPTSGRAYWDRQ